jgi:hypothetical protein
MENKELFRLDRSAFRIIKKDKEGKSSDYWMTQTPEKRISAIEFLRKQYNGTESRLQRVYRITNLK